MYEVFIGDEPFKLLYSNDRTKSSWADPFINLCRLPGGMKPWCCLASKPKCQIVPNLPEGSQRLFVHHLHSLEADGCLVDNQKWGKCLAPAGACGVPCGNAHWAPRRWCYHGLPCLVCPDLLWLWFRQARNGSSKVWLELVGVTGPELRWYRNTVCIAGCSVSTGSHCIPFSRFSDPHWKLDQTSRHQKNSIQDTLPETNSSPLKMMVSSNLLFHRVIFRCHVSFR